MPRKKKRKSMMGYFRAVFAQHPEWLHATTNAVILEQYRKDHGLANSAAVPGRVKASLANTKSLLRNEARKGGRKKTRAAAVAMPSGKRLEALEVAIDDCLILAKTTDAERLARVIDHLRRARNLVVWQMGQP